MKKFIITDWMNNHLFIEKEFSDFDDAWCFIYSNISDDDDAYDDYIVIQID